MSRFAEIAHTNCHGIINSTPFHSGLDINDPSLIITLHVLTIIFPDKIILLFSICSYCTYFTSLIITVNVLLGFSQTDDLLSEEVQHIDQNKGLKMQTLNTVSLLYI